jgi:hypothetical protein
LPQFLQDILQINKVQDPVLIFKEVHTQHFFPKDSDIDTGAGIGLLNGSVLTDGKSVF